MKTQQMDTAVEYELADRSHVLTCNTCATLPLSFITAAGRLIVRNVKVHVTEEPLEEVLIGREILRVLGVDPEEAIKNLIACDTNRIVDMHSLGEKSSGDAQFGVNKNYHDHHERPPGNKDQTSCEQLRSTSSFSYYGTDHPDEDEHVWDSIGDGEGDPPLDTFDSQEEEKEINTALKKLVEGAIANGLPTELKTKLEDILHKHRTVWRMALRPGEPPADIEPMDIRVVPGAVPFRCKPRRYPPLHAEFLRQHMKKLEQAGFVYRNPHSPWASPAVVVKKPNGELRCAVDMRGVNQVTIPTAWPLPIQENLSDYLQGSKCYAKLDLTKAFWQMGVKEDKQEYFSIQTNEGVYTSTRSLQGSRCATQYFTAGMQEALGPLLWKAVAIWVDDILAWARTPEELIQRLDAVLECFSKRGLRLSAAKCELFLKKTVWCGRLISDQGVHPDPEGVKALVEMEKPETADQLQQFICAMNWTRNNLPEFVRVTAPLYNLLQQALATTTKRSKREAQRINLTSAGWGEEHDEAFANCKQLLINAVTLAHPDPQQVFCLFTDASNTSWGAILTQIPEEDLDLPVHEQRHTPLQFLGGRFTKTERHWHVLEREAYALVTSCVRLEHLLLREKGFRLFTDHRNLLFLFSAEYRPGDLRKYTIEKLERWAMRLQAFHYVIEHIPGEDNVWADLLSRWGSTPSGRGYTSATARSVNVTDSSVDCDAAVEVQVLDNAGTSGVSTRSGSSANEPAGNISGTTLSAGRSGEHSANTDRTAGELARRRAALCYVGVRPLQQEEFVWPDMEEISATQMEHLNNSGLKNVTTDENGVIRLNDRIWIPIQATNLKTRLMVIAHCGSAGHRGINATMSAINSRFTWRNMSKDIKDQCQKCLHCVVTRGGQVMPRPLGSAMQATTRNEVLSFDFMYVSDLGDGGTKIDTPSKNIPENGHEYKYILVLNVENEKVHV